MQDKVLRLLVSSSFPFREVLQHAFLHENEISAGLNEFSISNII